MPRVLHARLDRIRAPREVKDKGLVWDRPFADEPDVFFTIPHFDGYPAVPVRLDHIDEL